MKNMKTTLKPIAAAAAVLALAACVSMPVGPSQLALPGTGKTFDQFRLDDSDCRQYASSQSGGATGDQVAMDSGVKSAVLGTVIGAAAGAAMNGGRGAGVGAGVGLLGGTLAGTAAGSESAYSVQRRYDNAYTQCMYAKGHRVPVSGNFTSAPAAPSAGAGYPPPPPPGSPPPPPPR